MKARAVAMVKAKATARVTASMKAANISPGISKKMALVGIAEPTGPPKKKARTHENLDVGVNGFAHPPSPPLIPLGG